MKNPIWKTAAFGLILSLTVAQGSDAEPPANEETKADPRALNGAYEMKLPGGQVRKRLMVDGRWEITQADPETGLVMFHHGGAYVFDGKSYVETVDYAGSSTTNMIGLVHKFVITNQRKFSDAQRNRQSLE